MPKQICPRCNATIGMSTVDVWDHIVDQHHDWMRQLISLPDDNHESAIKSALRESFPGVVG